MGWFKQLGHLTLGATKLNLDEDPARRWSMKTLAGWRGWSHGRAEIRWKECSNDRREVSLEWSLGRLLRTRLKRTGDAFWCPSAEELSEMGDDET